MNWVATYRVIAGLVVIGFILRYKLLEKRVEQKRSEAIEHATINRVIPWRDWVAWRQGIIEQEFVTDGT